MVEQSTHGVPLVTFIVPVAPYHAAQLERALASIEAQTVPCETVVIHDTEQRGAGYARNKGIEQVRTPLLVCLDADDWIEPTFVEECLNAYEGRGYVYTDWWRWQYDEALQDYRSVIAEAPTCPWKGDGSWHVITTLLPTSVVRQLGGFDETLPGFEDADFYWKLTRSGLCGKHVALPLFHYSKDGQRAQAFYHRPDRDEISRSIVERYRSKPMTCGGCGGTMSAPEYAEAPIGEQQQGDVLATALWAGNRQERGRATGRLYPRTGNGKELWVNPLDAQAAPHLFGIAPTMLTTDTPIEDGFATFRSTYRETMGVRAMPRERASDSFDPLPAPPQGRQADVGRVLRLYAQTN